MNLEKPGAQNKQRKSNPNPSETEIVQNFAYT